MIDTLVLKDETRALELYHVDDLQHSDSMLVALLPKERILFTADFNVPREGNPSAHRSLRWCRTSTG